MAEESSREKGEAMFAKVYGGAVQLAPPEARDDYVNDVVDHLFGKVWPRSALPIRDRRLVIIGIAIAQGEDPIIEIQLRSALANGELSPQDIRDILTMMPYYVGYPRAGRLQGIVRRILDDAPPAAE